MRAAGSARLTGRLWRRDSADSHGPFPARSRGRAAMRAHRRKVAPDSALTRRRFMALLAAGTAAAAASAPARALAAPRKKAPAPAPHRSPAIEKGIAEQKAYLAQQLKVIRDYPLPPGSDPAFVFGPLVPRRRPRQRSGR